MADLAEESGDKAEKRCFVWEEGGDAGSAFDFLVDALKRVACAHALLVRRRQGEDSEAFWEIFFHPEGKFGGGF